MHTKVLLHVFDTPSNSEVYLLYVLLHDQTVYCTLHTLFCSPVFTIAALLFCFRKKLQTVPTARTEVGSDDDSPCRVSLVGKMITASSVKRSRPRICQPEARAPRGELKNARLVSCVGKGIHDPTNETYTGVHRRLTCASLGGAVHCRK